MRLSKQLCFLVAAAIASAVDGAPIGDKLQRRQAITLDLLPTQQVDVDGSREVPTILISDNGYQVGRSNCIGGNCESYSINMPPIKQMEDYIVPQTSYDPYAENYSPYSSYPPSRSNYYAPPPVQSQVISAVGPPSVAAQPLPTASGPPKWTNAGWNAPLIPTGTFADALQGTPTVPATVTPTSTTSAPVPVPGSVPQAQVPAPAVLPTGQPAPAAPLPQAVPVPGAATPTTVPPPAPAPGVEVKDDKKDPEVKPGEAPPPPAPAPAPAPAPQRRSLRSGQVKSASSSAIKKRSPAPKRLQKRQLEPFPTKLPSVACDPSTVEKVEVLVPVTEEELASIQDGTAEIVSYPSVNPDGIEEKLYDVLPVTPQPALSVPTLHTIYEEGAQKMSAREVEPVKETLATSEKMLEARSPDEEAQEAPKSRSLNAGSEDAPKVVTLEKRLKYGK